MFEDSNNFVELWDLLHSGSATFSEYYEVVFSEQKLMKRYRFKRTQLTNDLHEIVYSIQKHLMLYSFMRTASTDSDFDDSEDSYIRNSDARMTNWHFRDVDFPDSFCSSLMNDVA